jgi:transcriptional antiterminator NusG
MNDQNDLQDEQVHENGAAAAERAAEPGPEVTTTAAPSATPFSDLFAQIERTVSGQAQAEPVTEAIPAPGEDVPSAPEAAGVEVAPPVSEAEPVAMAEVEAEAPAPAPPEAAAASEEAPQWYVVHCYSGQENKVRHNLEQRIASMGMKGKIFDVIVPTEEEIEVKDGKRRTVERRVFPGYILVQMIMGEDSWYVVRNTPGVTGFVGMGNTPTPLRPEEVAQILKRMEAEAPKVKVTYKPGQKVRIIDGPFNDFIGVVSEIDMDRTKVRVMVSFFGRETPVELDFLQVEKV